jgi:hypothetical protein
VDGARFRAALADVQGGRSAIPLDRLLADVLGHAEALIEERPMKVVAPA